MSQKRTTNQLGFHVPEAYYFPLVNSDSAYMKPAHIFEKRLAGNPILAPQEARFVQEGESWGRKARPKEVNTRRKPINASGTCHKECMLFKSAVNQATTKKPARITPVVKGLSAAVFLIPVLKGHEVQCLCYYSFFCFSYPHSQGVRGTLPMRKKKVTNIAHPRED